MKKIFLMVALMATVCIGKCYAEETAKGPSRVPAYPGLIIRDQPNGETLRTYLRGDEHKHWLMTEDGWQIEENKKGWLKYMKKTRKGSLRLSNRRAHNEEKRSASEIRWLKKHGIMLKEEQ
ncbi:MAG: hypothetical protein II457_01365 [Paludibacteraceae bacterium]|nr:hypothetical protein [Paludibacteraceae bacterium]